MTSDEKITRKLLAFIGQCPTAFHTVDSIRQILEKHGYRECPEEESWGLEAGGKYFVTRNDSSLIAFRIPERKDGREVADFTGYMIAASHSDSPAFRIKANPEMKSAGAYVRLNVERYGGMLIAPWFDRPLSVAGRIIIKEGNHFRTKLVNIDRDLVMIPNVAIHMNREANDGMHYNVQTDVLPVLGDETAEGAFAELIAEAAGVPKEQISGDDLFLYARVPGTIWGANREFVSSGHLDDLQCTYGDLMGFVESGEKAGGAPDAADAATISEDVSEDASQASGFAIPVLAVFDNEEVGSGTKQGADSTFLQDTLARIGQELGLTEEDQRRKLASSFMVSADNAHAVHPNAEGKADPVNRPRMNHGIVIKYSANQKYTTDAYSAALFRAIAETAGETCQDFTNRSDMVGGSTLGNISNAHVSVNTVDIGLPQLAMHSPYETAGVHDTGALIRVMKVFFSSALKAERRGRFSLI